MLADPIPQLQTIRCQLNNFCCSVHRPAGVNHRFLSLREATPLCFGEKTTYVAS